MGKFNKGRGKGRNKGGNRNNNNDRGRGRDDRGQNNKTWEFVLENARFEAFYKAMNFLKEGEDFDSFMKTLREPLPACFRINSEYIFGNELKRELHSFVGREVTVDIKGESKLIKAVEQLAWYPEERGCAYKLGTDKRAIRKCDQLSGLHQWLIKNTDNGNITRQEAVSMVPPLALDVHPHHLVLDMCAAPGSKTTQLLEIINKSRHANDEHKGLVVANDSDTDRAYMLVHQCRRINSAQLMICTHKGQLFPRVSQDNQSGYFDRVLADVPCSGDGTLRKNPMIWQSWSCSNSAGLHNLQLIIARRAVQLTKDDGLMVYSTCSMCPYEDEAVVAQLLRESEGRLELVDAREYLPRFAARPGLTNWLVLDDHDVSKTEKQKQKNKIKTQEAQTATSTEGQMEGKEEKEAPQGETPLDQCINLGMKHYKAWSEVPQEITGRMRQSFFPPTAEEATWMNLERCLRCVPQDEDTGGFFVATLRKKAKPASEAVSMDTVNEEAGESIEESSLKKAKTSSEDMSGESTKERAIDADAELKHKRAAKGQVDFSQWDTEAFERMASFYGLDKSVFPPESMCVRNDFNIPVEQASNQTANKSVYYIPKPMRDIMEATKDMKIVSAGMKVLERHVTKENQQSDYRLMQDASALLSPHMSSRVCDITAQDLSNLLEGGLVSVTTLSSILSETINTCDPGPIVCKYVYKKEDITEESIAFSASVKEGNKEESSSSSSSNELLDPVVEPAPFYVVCFRGSARAINVMCNKTEVQSMKHQLASLHVLRKKIASTRYKEAQETQPVAAAEKISADDATAAPAAGTKEA